MNWETILAGLWQALNSVPGAMLMAGLLGWLLTRLYSIRPAWEAYEGTIISGVKHAEKAIPDDVPNKGLARLDEALRYVLKVYAETHRGRQPSDALANELREGIREIPAQKTHHVPVFRCRFLNRKPAQEKTTMAYKPFIMTTQPCTDPRNF